MHRSVILAAALLGLAGCSAPPGTSLHVLTGSVGHFVCAGSFGSGEDPDRVYHAIYDSLPGAWLLQWGVDYNVDPERQTIRTRFLGGFESETVFSPDRGCLILHGETPPPAAAALPQSPPAMLPAIAGPAMVASADPRLGAILDAAFVEPTDGPPRHTKAVVILHDGRVIAERYAPGFGIDTPLPGNSLTKSVTNALVGILVREGRLAVDGPAPVAAWQDAHDPRHAISVEDLLRMRSGLDLGDSLSASLGSLWDPANRMLFAERDMAGFAESRRPAAAPGTRWTYSDGSYLILSRIIRDAAGGHGDAVRRFMQEALFGPLGIRHAIFDLDATGTPVGAIGLLASARDWARLGQLYLDDGMAGSRRILPQGWAAWSATPTAGGWVGYGAGFWTNRGDSYGARHRVQLGMPEEAYFGRGMFGQFLVIVPAARLVIARFGTSHGDQETAGMARLVADTLAALGGPSRMASAPRPGKP